MFPWLFYVMMCITGAVGYNIAVKVAGNHINPFVFTSGLTAVGLVGHLCCLGLYKFYLGEDVTFQADRMGLYMVLLGGISIVIVDLSFYFALKNGSMISTNLVWTVGAALLTTAAGYFLFKEPMTMTKMVGLAFGGISVYLLAKG